MAAAKETKKPIGEGWWLKALVLAMGILLVLDSVQILNMSAIVSRVDQYNQGVVDEMGGFKGDVESFGTDLNEIRKFLLLPEKNYSVGENPGGTDPAMTADEQQSSPEQTGLYAFLSQYSADQKTAQLKIAGEKTFTDLQNNTDFKAKLKELNLAWQNVPNQEMQAKLIDKMAVNADGSVNQLLDQPLFSIFFDTDKNAFHVQSAIEDKTYADYTDDSFLNSSSSITSYISANVDLARTKKIEQKNSAEQSVIQAAKQAQAKIDQQKTDFENTLKDPALVQTLADQGLKLSPTARSEENKLIYDVTDSSGQVKFSFALEISSGMIKVIRDGQELDVRDFNDQDGSKKKDLILPTQIPDYGDKAKTVDGQYNLLIVGKNGGLTDVMIFANINPATRQIRLVSIPRDLYYNNRKINSYYALFGMDELKRVISTITGYQIDKYLAIDMYAFIDVVDLIGGVDVHLDEPVIDPTYKTLDNGVWSTLYYRPGDYHLNGTQALRIARTRHTSSDFARAERQQIIIQAIQKKAQQFGFGDASKLNSIAQAVLARTETDINLADALADYFRYQGFEVVGGNVLSTANVLDQKYTGDLKTQQCLSDLTKTPQVDGQTLEPKSACQEDKGQYILVP